MNSSRVSRVSKAVGMMALIWIAAACSNDVTAPPTELQLSDFRFDLPSPAPAVVAGNGQVTITGRFFPNDCGRIEVFAQLRNRKLSVYVTSDTDHVINCPGVLRAAMTYTIVVRGLKQGELMVEVLQDPSSSEFSAKAPSTTVTVL